MRVRRILLATVSILALLAPAAVADPGAGTLAAGFTAGEGEVVAHIEFEGGTEIDFDGERYAYVGQFNGRYDRQTVAEGQEGGLRIIDLVGDDGDVGEIPPQCVRHVARGHGGPAICQQYMDPQPGTPQFDEVGYLNCPGTDNYIRYMDPAVYGGEDGRKYVVMAHHGNLCTSELLEDDPHTTSGYGARNGIAIIDVTDPTAPELVDAIGHWSAHTVMPHPTRPYLFVLPGGTANGTSAPSRISPTGIIDASDPTDLDYVTSYEHNLTGCHDLGFTADGDHAYCAGLGEIQVWDIAGDNIASPVVVGTIVNPAIMFPHNAVISPSGQYLLINDEAFGFHTCTGAAADLYGSLWIYDISVPELPVLAGRISPPERGDHVVGLYTDWVEGWCAAHNYNFVPGTDIVVASWFAGGMTAHDISDPLQPELLAAYQPGEGSVMWSAHYYGGYVLTGDMDRGTEILDIPVLREAEAAAAAGEGPSEGAGLLPVASSSPTSVSGVSPASLSTRIDRSDVLIPAVLPPRPLRPQGDGSGGFCVLPGRAI